LPQTFEGAAWATINEFDKPEAFSAGRLDQSQGDRGLTDAQKIQPRNSKNQRFGDLANRSRQVPYLIGWGWDITSS